jgi:hypothetical protein
MSSRAPTLIAAIALLVLIGLSGVASGGGLLSVTASADAPSVDVRGAALGLGVGIAGYGIVCLFAAAGLWSRSRWAWLLGIAAVALGLVAIVVATSIAGLDSVLGLGLVVWGAAFACLVAPATRRSIAVS